MDAAGAASRLAARGTGALRCSPSCATLAPCARSSGVGARVSARRELQRRRNRRSVAVELADGSCVMLKYYWRAELVAQESVRLRAANALGAIDTPRLRGATRHHLVQDFIPGEGLDVFAKRTPREARLALFLRAAHVLAAIHGSPRPAPGSLRLAEAFAPGAARGARAARVA